MTDGITDYEKFGNHDNVVFPCANPVIDEVMHIYASRSLRMAHIAPGFPVIAVELDFGGVA